MQTRKSLLVLLLAVTLGESLPVKYSMAADIVDLVGPAGLLGTHFIPGIRISERYDSNVFLAPNIPGLDREDFVTSVAPSLAIIHNTPYVTLTATGGAIAEYYVKNPALGYIGTNAGAVLGLTPLLNRYSPGATLSLSYGFAYTPLPPSFISGGAYTKPAPQDQTTADLPIFDSYLRGLQAARVNTTVHSVGIGGSLPLTSTVKIQSNYGFSRLNYGDRPTQLQGQAIFNPATGGSVVTHSLRLGPVYKATVRDTVNFAYTYSQTAYSRSPSQNTEGDFKSHSGTLGWSRLLSPELVAGVGAGASIFQGEVAGSSTSSGNLITYNGYGVLSWQRGFDSFFANYSVGVYPSIVGATGPAISHVADITGLHKFNDQLAITAGFNYSNFRTVTGVTTQPPVTFRSYVTNVGLIYTVSPTTRVLLNHTFGVFQGSSFGGFINETEYTRNAVTLSLISLFPW